MFLHNQGQNKLFFSFWKVHKDYLFTQIYSCFHFILLLDKWNYEVF